MQYYKFLNNSYYKSLYNFFSSHYFLFSFLTFLTIFTRYLEKINWNPLLIEFSAIEMSQNILLILTILIIFYNRKFLKKYPLISIKTKILLLLFILYEEISYISKYFYKGLSFINLNNLENEINLHNDQIFSYILFRDIPIFGEIGLRPIVFALFFFLIGYGSYFSKKIFQNFRFIFLDKKYSHFSNIYILNLLFSGFLRYLNIINLETEYILHFELEEIFFYYVLLIDSLKKIDDCSLSV